MTQRTHWPVSEQLADGYHTLQLARLDGRGFTALAQQDSERRARHARNWRSDTVPGAYLASVPGARYPAALSFTGALLTGGLLGKGGTHPVVICRREHEDEARQHLTAVRLPGILGLVDGAELTWVGSCGTDVLDNPLAGHLLHLGQTGTWAKIGITPMLGLQLLDVGYPAHFYTENQTSYLVGPVVVEVEHVLREYQDTDRIRLFDFDEQAEIDYWVPDLDPLELDTYARLRRDGFQVGAARTAVQLITA